MTKLNRGSPMADEMPCAVPLVELLRRIPRDARYQWTDESECTHYHPIGSQAHEAADRLSSLEEALRRAALDLHEAAGRFCEVSKLDAKGCSELTREAARRAETALGGAETPPRQDEQGVRTRTSNGPASTFADTVQTLEEEKRVHVQALSHYAAQYCEGWCEEVGSGGMYGDCGGCIARIALSAGVGPLHTPMMENR